MLSISGFLTTKGYLLIPVLIVAVYFLRRWLSTTAGKHAFHRFVLKIPAINGIIQKVAVARFARTFSALMGSGAAVLESLEVTSHSVGNVVYEEALLNAAKEVENGKNLSTIIEKTGLFPPIVSQMLAVGEETGQTDVVLVKVADFYEEEVDVAIDSIGSIIEPVMIVLMGGMVGLIAASVMMPIAGLSTSIKQ
jgi:type II secretion system protein